MIDISDLRLNNNHMNIVCCLDNNFVLHCAVLMTSVMENNRYEHISFYLIYSELSARSICLLRSIVESYGKNIKFCKFNNTLLNHCPVSKNDHVSLTTYYRILIPLILPDNVKKVLYLDCDIVINSGLSELWNMDIGNKSIGVVYDAMNDVNNNKRLNYEESLGYFNAGVLLIDLESWRKKQIATKLLNYIDKKREYLKYHDQDALNYIFREDKFILHPKYNFQDGFIKKENTLFELYQNYWLDFDPVIIHFTGNLKPWHIGSKHPYKFLYKRFIHISKLDKYYFKIYLSKNNLRWMIRHFLCFIRILRPLNQDYINIKY